MIAFYRLPDGNLTKSSRVYLRAWTKFVKPIEKATKSRCYSFNSGLGFISYDASTTWRLGMFEAKLFREIILKKEKHHGKVGSR